MRGISIKAIVLASLAVLGVDIVSGVLLVVGFGGPALTGDMTDEQRRAAASVLLQDRGYLTAVLVLGAASTVLGGYLTARLADSRPYFNALAFGALAVIVGVLTSADLPTWFRVVGLGLTVPAALLGAHLSKRRRP